MNTQIILSSFLIVIIRLNLVNTYALNSFTSSANSSPDYLIESNEESSKIKWPINLLQLNYSSLIKINKDCRYTPDKCDYGAKRTRKVEDLDCFCDQNCKEFGNCCLDAAELNKFVNNIDLNLSNKSSINKSSTNEASINESTSESTIDESSDQKTLINESKFIEKLEQFNRFKEDYDCKELTLANSYRYLFVKSKCPSDFSNHLIRHKCEQHNLTFGSYADNYRIQFDVDYKDPFQTIPITSTKSGITYSNIFCALCNEYKDNLIQSYTNLVKNQTPELRFWKMNVTCDNLSLNNITLDQNTSFQEFLNQNFTYQSDSWLVQYTNEHGKLERRDCTFRIHMPEDLQFYIKQCMPNLIDRCSPNWSSTENLEKRRIEALCAAYQSRVNLPEKKQEYRNVHCAICNFVDINQLGCPANLQIQSIADQTIMDGRSSSLASFNALFDVNFVIGKTNLVGKMSYCTDEDSIYDPIFQKCRSIICGFNQQFFGGECRLPIIEIKSNKELENSLNRTEIDLITTESSEINLLNHTENDFTSIDSEDQSFNQQNEQFTVEFKKCAKIVLKFSSDYLVLKNDSVYLKHYDLVIDKGNYNLTNSELLICIPFSALLDKFENHYSLIAYICLLFSIVCLTFYLIVFCLVPDLRNLSGRNLSSLCVSLIMVYCCFAIAPLESIQNEIKFCKLIAFIKYYGLLASFCWTGVIAFDIYQTIRNSLNAFRYKTGPQSKRFLIYSLICWLLPSCAILFAWLTENGQFNAISDEFKPNFGVNKECWFSHRKSLLVFFVLPVGLITILNLIFFLLTSKNLLLTTNRNKLKLSGSATSKFDFNLYLRLFLLMGLTWMFGFLATYFDKIYLWYLFTLFNTLQGVFIFIAFGCKKTVMKKLKIKFSKLFLLDQFNLNKNGSTTTTCRTPTNQSTITHLNSSKIFGNCDPDMFNEFKTKELLFNKLNDNSINNLSLSKSIGDLYVQNYYSTESIDKNQLQLSPQSDDSQVLSSHHRQIRPNSSSTFNPLNSIDNRSSFKYPSNSSQINNSQINRWFDF